jgi:hypothetical protein
VAYGLGFSAIVFRSVSFLSLLYALGQFSRGLRLRADLGRQGRIEILRGRLAHAMAKDTDRVPVVEIERAMKRKELFEKNPKIHTYVKEIEDGKD